MLSSIRPYGLPAEPARNAPTGRPKPGPAEPPTEAGRTAPGGGLAPTPTPLPTDSGSTAPEAALDPSPAAPAVDDAALLAASLLRLTYRADGRASEGPPAPTGRLLDRRG
jgi:hypothetical protein